MEGKKRKVQTVQWIMLFAIMLFVISMPMKAKAALTGTFGENVTYTIDTENHVLTISGSGDMKDVDCSDIRYGAVMKVPGAPWKKIVNDYKITSVIIEDGVTSIGDGAFAFCDIENVEIPDSVTRIGDFAFYNCIKMRSIEIPDSVTSIGEGIFEECSILSDIKSLGSIKSIADNAFDRCYKLESIELPSGVTEIGNRAFYECEKLKTVVLPEGVTSIGDYAFEWCSELKELKLPDSVTKVGKYAFCGCKGVSVLPKNIEDIGEGAFSCTGFTEIKIPKSMTSIEKDVFAGCSGVTSIEIPDTITSIGEGAFSDCSSVESLEIPEGVTSIGDAAFSNWNSLKSIELPESLLSIGKWTFINCKALTEIKIPDNVTTISEGAFIGCTKLISIAIPEGVTKIEASTFYDCIDLKKVVIPKSVTSIGEEAFCISDNYIATMLEDAVCYCGTKEEWEQIEIGEGNSDLLNAYLQYDYMMELSIPYSAASEVYPELKATYISDYFDESAYNYNHDLAWLSLCLELASWTADETTWGEEGADDSALAQSRYANIASAYEQMRFDTAKYYNYGMALNETENKVAYSIATKADVYGDTLVAVAIRGGGYGGEWSSNFSVGEKKGYHNGFSEAAEEVVLSLRKEIYEIDGDVKIWITGYSRGAAVANLVAAAMVDTAADPYITTRYSKFDVYAYTFATPQGAPEGKNGGAYNNYRGIFNIVNPGDVVPLVAPSGWGFDRYGITRYFNTSASAETLSAVNKSYNMLSGEQFSAANNLMQSAAGTALMDIILSMYPSTSSSVQIQEVLQEFLEFMQTKKCASSDSEGDAWENIEIGDYYDILEERYGEAFFTSYQNTHSFLTVMPIGKQIMQLVSDNQTLEDNVYLFFTLCDLHDIEALELADKVYSLINSENILNALDVYLGMADGIGGMGTAHEPAVYLAWMSLKEEYTFGETETTNEKGTTVVSVSCPVDIKVYDQDGVVVASVQNHKLIDADIPVVCENETTNLYLASNMNYKVKVIPTDSGKMTYTVTERDIRNQVTNCTKYCNIPLKEGQVFTGNIETTEEDKAGKYDLVCTEGEKEIIVPEAITNPFTDTVVDEWYFPYVKYVYKNGIMAGTGDGTTFSPMMNLSRAQFVTVLWRHSGSPEMIYSNIFDDLPNNQWYTEAVIWANKNNVVQGIGNGKFGTNDNITREQMAVMMYQYAVSKGYDVSQSVELFDYRDSEEVSEWAETAMKWAVGNKIITGKGNNMLDPWGNASRAECAAIIMRFIEKYE